MQTPGRTAMPKNTEAHKILWPTDPKVVVRVVFLHVGQGSSIVALVRDGDTYRLVLFDCNLDVELGGLDVPAFIKDLSPDGHLSHFVNTHPHDDHLHGVKELAEAVIVDNVWHSGHIPSKKYGTYHADLKALIADVEKRNGAEAVVEMEGSRTPRDLFDASVYFLAPAEHVKDEVNEEEADARYRRIHENCAVLRLGKDPGWVLITGDADLVAFRDHILGPKSYHKDRLPAFLLDAPHHGSRSFFKDKEEDEPYLDALEIIDPEFVVISAPEKKESPHGHPHDDAVAIYADQVGGTNVFHTGKERECFFFDIFEDGTHGEAQSDEGALVETYGLDKKDDDDGGGGGGGGKVAKAVGPFVRPSAPGEFKPRKYG
jgi:beta-lactamase superfamily II metal-dependent hydrolase